jgi:hypothetical protein
MASSNPKSSALTCAFPAVNDPPDSDDTVAFHVSVPVQSNETTNHPLATSERVVVRWVSVTDRSTVAGRLHHAVTLAVAVPAFGFAVPIGAISTRN